MGSFTVLINPIMSVELLFGKTPTETDEMVANQQPEYTNYLYKFVFDIYMLILVVVLVIVLVAMMSDTYHRIQVFSFIYLS